MQNAPTPLPRATRNLPDSPQPDEPAETLPPAENGPYWAASSALPEMLDGAGTAPFPLDSEFQQLPPNPEPQTPYPSDATLAALPLDSPARPSPLRRVLHILGIDRAVGFTVLARGWTSLSGIATLTLIARMLSPAEQGFYYTFYSLVAMQIVFELGFSVVILQTASHEAAHLHIASDGVITGDATAHTRLASVLQKSVKWYTVAAVLMGAALVPVGIHFFHATRQPVGSPPVHWLAPWLVAVLATVFTFQIDPLFSFLEGCGYVPQVARARLTQAMLGVMLGWAALLTHHGLFAPGLVIGGQAIAGGVFVWTRRRLLLPLLRRATAHLRIDWAAEIWPFQWRIAISWLCGYLTFQLFNPILFHYRGAVEAGRMGMSMNICATLSSVAIAWMNTKAAPMGRLIALGEYAALDRLFFRSLLQSVAAACVAFSGVWGVLHLLAAHHITWKGVQLGMRVLPAVPLGMLFFGAVGNIVVFAEALYLRAHKQEKFMINSILGAVYTVPIAFLLGRLPQFWGGAWGISAAYALGTLVIGLGYGTYTFLKWRRIWHAAA